MSNESKSAQNGLPFPKRWLYYIALKLILLALVIYLVLHWNGLL